MHLANPRKQRESGKSGASAFVRALMAGLIDYAGLFPPAGLSMERAVTAYAHYKDGEHAWMLGRFVVPVERLDEFAGALTGIETSSPWRLSALAGDNVDADLEVIAEFNRAFSAKAVVDVIEIRLEGEFLLQPQVVLDAGLMPYFETVPVHATPFWLWAESGARAKLRTGGIVPGMFPPPEVIADFLFQCAAAQLPFKATAGLHHALRSIRPLTYDPDSPSTLMYGFLNVFLAAGWAWKGASREEIVQILEERDPAAFDFREDAVRWRGQSLSAAQIREMRERFAISFGSCSFEEPIAELEALCGREERSDGSRGPQNAP